VVQHERERELDQRGAGLLRKLGQRVGCGELALVGGVAHIEAVGGARRGCRPLRSGVLAVVPREPAASQRAVWMTPSPYCSQVGGTSCSRPERGHASTRFDVCLGLKARLAVRSLRDVQLATFEPDEHKATRLSENSERLHESDNSGLRRPHRSAAEGLCGASETEMTPRNIDSLSFLYKKSSDPGNFPTASYGGDHADDTAEMIAFQQSARGGRNPYKSWSRLTSPCDKNGDHDDRPTDTQQS
jgi:hypothetical protein